MVNQHYLPHSGGGYSYYNILLQAINAYEFGPEISITNIVLYQQRDQTELIKLKKPCIYIHENRKTNWRRLLRHRLLRQLNSRFIRKNRLTELIITTASEKQNQKIESTLRENKIDLVYYLNPVDQVLNYPFITTHWDVGHRSTFPFPEISMNGNYETRENYYSNILNKALFIICESLAGATELNKYYQFISKKIKVLPLFGGGILGMSVSTQRQHRILEKYDLEKERFLMYPAQFWPHKNHYTLIKAFYKYKAAHPDRPVRLVLCGSDKGNLRYIRQVISFLGLDKSVVLTGFVNDDELYSFYTNSIALIMPTFLGPTNLPVIEAPWLHCPVLCSDLEGHREILADNALYFDPQNTESIKKAIELIMDDDFRKELANRAFLHIKASPFNIASSLGALNGILKQAKSIRKTWGPQ